MFTIPNTISLSDSLFFGDPSDSTAAVVSANLDENQGTLRSANYSVLAVYGFFWVNYYYES